MNIIGFHVSKSVIANSEGEFIDDPPYLKWLLNHKPNTIQVFYDLGFLKDDLLNLAGIQGRSKDELLNTTQLEIHPYKFRYVPNKFFSIKRNNRLSYFCDMNQYLGQSDGEKLQILDGENDVEYCIRLANDARKIGLKVYEILDEFNVKPLSLSSLSRIYDNVKNTNCDFKLSYDELKNTIENKLCEL